MERWLWCIAALVLASSACADGLPVAPTNTPQPRQPETAVARVSGWVYAQVDWGDPPLVDTLITVTQADGSEQTTVSDAGGFYALSVRAGVISISAAKEGYEAKTWELSLSKDTVLNFGLVPR
jgi:hypothetical protein